MNLSRKTLRNIFLVVVGGIILYWLLFDTDRVKTVWEFFTSMLSPFLLGAGLAFVINVPMSAIEAQLKGIKKTAIRRLIAVLLTLVAVALILVLVVQLLLPQLVSTVDTLYARLPRFFNQTREIVVGFLESKPELLGWVQNNTDFEQIEWSALVEKLVSFVGGGISTIVGGAFSAVGSVTTGIFNGVISLVFSLYCLFGKETLAGQARRLLYAFFPEKFSDETVRILRLTSSTFGNFISGQCLEACILGVMCAICMLILRMPYVPLVSVLVALTALVPIVGAFVGCGLSAFFILVDDPMKAVWFVVMFLVIQQIEGNVIYPKVVGSSVGLPGMWVLLAVAVGGKVMGVAGMFVMIPLASVLYTLLREVTNKRLAERNIEQNKLVAQPPEQRERPQPTPKEKKPKKKKKKKKKK